MANQIEISEWCYKAIEEFLHQLDSDGVYLADSFGMLTRRGKHKLERAKAIAVTRVLDAADG